MNVTTVVLDLGNVLIGWDPRRVWSRTMSEAEIDRFVTEVGFEQLNRSLDAGRLYSDARAEVERDWPQHLAALDSYWHGFAESLTGPVEGTERLVDELRRAGVRLLGLTNWSAETFHLAPHAAPAIAELEDVLVSGRERLSKPDPAIFRLLIERYSLVPEQTLFVDDVLANVESARSLGMLAHRFQDAATLRADLLARGVAISPQASGPAGS